jgi:hypothetical protein
MSTFQQIMGGGGGAGYGGDKLMGTWSPTTNTPTLADGDAYSEGQYFRCIDSADRNLGSGTIEFTFYDEVKKESGIWIHINRHPMPENLIVNASGELIVNASNEFIWSSPP